MTLPEPDGLLFDLDGTLVESMPDLHDALDGALKHHGGAGPTVVFEGTIEGIVKVGHGFHQGPIQIEEQAVGFGQGHGRRPWLVKQEAISRGTR